MKRFKRIQCLGSNLVKKHVVLSRPALMPDISPYRADDFNKRIGDIFGNDSSIFTTVMTKDIAEDAPELFNSLQI
jgi:hypothetical protein